MKIVLKVCGCLIFVYMNVVQIYSLFDATFLIKNTSLDFIIIPMRKCYPPSNGLLTVALRNALSQNKN